MDSAVPVFCIEYVRICINPPLPPSVFGAVKPDTSMSKGPKGVYVKSVCAVGV